MACALILATPEFLVWISQKNKDAKQRGTARFENVVSWPGSDGRIQVRWEIVITTVRKPIGVEDIASQEALVAIRAEVHNQTSSNATISSLDLTVSNRGLVVATIPMELPSTGFAFSEEKGLIPERKELKLAPDGKYALDATNYIAAGLLREAIDTDQTVNAQQNFSGRLQFDFEK